MQANQLDISNDKATALSAALSSGALTEEQKRIAENLLQRFNSVKELRKNQDEAIKKIRETSLDTSIESAPQEEDKQEINFWTILKEMGSIISNIPRFALNGLFAAFNPYNIANIYSGWVGKYAALAAFSYAVANFTPTFVRAGLAFMVRAAFPQLSIAADLLQFMTSPGFVFASLAAAAQLFDKGVAGEAGKIFGKDQAKDFVKGLVKFPKETATGRTWGDWRQYIFSKTVEIAGLIGGTFGTAYGVFLAQSATVGGTSFIAALPVVGPIAAVGAGLLAVASNIGVLALGSFAAGVVMFSSKEIYDIVGGFGSSFGQQKFVEAYTAGVHVANRTGIDTRYEAAKAAASTRYEGAKATASNVYESASTKASNGYASAMMFTRKTADATTSTTQNEEETKRALGDTAAPSNDESCVKTTMKALCRMN